MTERICRLNIQVAERNREETWLVEESQMESVLASINDLFSRRFPKLPTRGNGLQTAQVYPINGFMNAFMVLKSRRSIIEIG
uniref:Uncharacterized protein n=1 Tax=Desulfatirhabdium butyrativorans TaxID=340467 RepID=A0A7C4VRQ8_9BACT